MKLLLVEDEIRMAQALIELLRLENYVVDYCADGIAGMDAVESNQYDIIILDIMLPGKNGLDIVKDARAAGIQTPILLLTAKCELDDKVDGLDCGADDYLTKPFMTKELMARLRALGRRRGEISSMLLEFGDIYLDSASSVLVCKTTEQSVVLSEKEYRLLEYMITNKGQTLTREQLALRIWGFDSEAEYNNVEVYMSFTRKKLQFVKSKTEIKAVRGIGYRLRYEHV